MVQAEELAHLERAFTDAASGTLNEQPPARPEPGTWSHCHVSRSERVGYGRGSFKGQVVRDGYDVGRGTDCRAGSKLAVVVVSWKS